MAELKQVVVTVAVWFDPDDYERAYGETAENAPDFIREVVAESCKEAIGRQGWTTPDRIGAKLTRY